MRPFAVWLVVFVLFAGCTDAPDAPDAPAAPDDPTDGTPSSGGQTHGLDLEAGVPAPEWKVGDWWSYTVTYASGESYDATIVVYGEDGGNHLITADDRDLVVRSSFNHYPNFSPVSKADLSQTIHGDTVSDLRFPMKNGTWSGTYRDFEANWETTFEMLSTPQGEVPGFTTTMRNADDGRARITQSWSPVTKWFTAYAFDFDGNGPVDVTYTVQDWGSGFNGTVPVLDVIDGVHRTFPAYAVSPPDPANPPAAPGTAESTDTVNLVEEGASLLWGVFAGAGGAGHFEMDLLHKESGRRFSHPWQPQSAGAYFAWGELADQPTGSWDVTGTAAAQGHAFLFIEVYEVRTREVQVTAG